jgi:hypothetical protein
MMPALLLALTVVLAAWLTWDVATDCNQNCDQGRQCTCGKRSTDEKGEPQ